MNILTDHPTSVHGLEIGKLYILPHHKVHVPLFRKYYVAEKEEQINFLEPSEYFMLLEIEKGAKKHWIKILTSNGNIGWCIFYSGDRFEELICSTNCDKE